MTTLNAALNYTFTNAESARIAAAERGAGEAIATQLQQAAANTAFRAGSTITARYQYKVAEDGSLVPLQTQITTDHLDEAQVNGNGGRRQSRQTFREQQERRTGFADITRPKPELSPTDELTIFAALNNAQLESSEAKIAGIPSQAEEVPAFAEVVDDNGALIQAEILTPQSTRADAPKQSFAPTAQFSVAALYARNNDVVYHMTPIARFAA